VVAPVKIKFAELSKFRTLDCGFLQYINIDIQIIRFQQDKALNLQPKTVIYYY